MSAKPASLLEPVARNIDDARALSNSRDVPDELVARVVPGLCRTAVEAACVEAIRRRWLASGVAHAAVEQRLADVTATMPLAALALFDDAGRGGEVYARVNRWGRDLGDTLRWCKEGDARGRPHRPSPAADQDRPQRAARRAPEGTCMTTTTPTDPAVLLKAAHSVIDRRHNATRGVWPKAAALLGRQALETAISQRFPEIANASRRARNLCLPTLLGDRELARDLIQSWGALSRATHHHAYDLPPTATELEHWLEPVAELISRGPDADRAVLPRCPNCPQPSSCCTGDATEQRHAAVDPTRRPGA